MSREGLAPSESGPKILTLQLHYSEEMEEMAKVVIEFLKSVGVYTPNLLFSGFNGARLKQFVKKGFDAKKDENFSPAVFCTTEPELYREYDEFNVNTLNALEYAVEGYDLPALALYDGNFLEPTRDGRHHCFKPKEGKAYRDALVAVIKIKVVGG